LVTIFDVSKSEQNGFEIDPFLLISETQNFTVEIVEFCFRVELDDAGLLVCYISVLSQKVRLI
jgi:hypothetical protein